MTSCVIVFLQRLGRRAALTETSKPDDAFSTPSSPRFCRTLEFFTADLDLTDRLVLITGGSKGIGLACAHAFLAEGARVAIVSRDPANLAAAEDTLAAPGRVHTFAADLQDPHQALAVVDAVETGVGPIDVLVASAGAARRTPFAELDAAAWHAALQVKFFSYIQSSTRWSS